jgi:all-trans-retinol 13,14-reductase
MSMENKFDVIIIGSGMGAMSAASVLSRLFRKRVLIVEKHFTFGGLTHEFTRNETSFDSGLHLLGEMDEGSQAKKIFDFITGHRIRMQKMPAYYDSFIYPDIQFRVDSNPKQYLTDLSNVFPEERKSIVKYFKDVHAYMQLLTLATIKSSVPKLIRPILDAVEWVYTHLPNIHIDKFITTKAYLDKRFKSQKLKNILASQWGYYGMLPSESAMLMHAVIVEHYLRGAWFPIHGPKKIGEAVQELIKEQEGEILLNNAVENLIIENNVVKGVRLGKPDSKGVQEYYSDIVISNIGADLTYNHLLPASGINFTAKREALKKLKGKNNFIVLYLTLNESPASLGFDGGNVFWFRYNDHEKDISSVYQDDFPTTLFISFPTLKGQDSKKHTAEVIATVPYIDFERWADRPWMNRGEEYETLKASISTRIIDVLEKQYRGFKSLIEDFELATPLTIAHFTGRVNGSSYGLIAIPDRFRLKWLTPTTPVKNLFLSGQDVMTPGIVAAMMGGISAAGAAIGPGGFIKVMVALSKQDALFNKSKPTIRQGELKVIGVTDETEEAYTITFSDEEGLLKYYKAGQYITLTLEFNHETIYRSYSLTSSPALNEPPSITVKKLKGGSASNYLKEHLKIGDKIKADGPSGQLTWETSLSSKNDYLMIAGGCGVTPIFSLTKNILKEEPDARITFLYANRDVKQIIFRNQLKNLSQQYESRLTVSHYLSDEISPAIGITGYITKPVLSQSLGKLKSIPFVFMCAPEVMTNLMEGYLSELGIPNDHVFMERFSFKPFNIKMENSIDSKIYIQAKNIRYEVEVPAGTVLLEPLIKGKVPIKYSCRMGVCGVCRCKLTVGSVSMVKNVVLSKEEIAGGEILLCTSIATSAIINIQFNN